MKKAWILLYYDYNCNNNNRKYGIWDVKKIKILSEEEYPSPEEEENLKLENSVWGTYGKDGKGPLKYILLKDAKKEHLEAILKTEYISLAKKEQIRKILKTKK